MRPVYRHTRFVVVGSRNRVIAGIHYVLDDVADLGLGLLGNDFVSGPARSVFVAVHDSHVDLQFPS